FWEKSPFELSGGQMRRVAIAGILAMEPEVLVLDEPTAGLDPKARIEMMKLFESIHQTGQTVVLVTNLMDDVADYADYV
ncbi:ATP-binding cassette domain-containing protein, partial [Staphylococcus epidermidis]|uniref:ATP-binding cassette domain-containing protein n=1 Tax=Staphylococcus epidermidis TaxID=1282 RepID=UPI0030BDE108